MANPRVEHVAPHNDGTLQVRFSNGELREFDVKPYMPYMGSQFFAELRDPEYFSQVQVVPPGTGIESPNEQDLSKDTLYLGSSPVHGDGSDTRDIGIAARR